MMGFPRGAPSCYWISGAAFVRGYFIGPVPTQRSPVRGRGIRAEGTGVVTKGNATTAGVALSKRSRLEHFFRSVSRNKPKRQIRPVNSPPMSRQFAAPIPSSRHAYSETPKPVARSFSKILNNSGNRPSRRQNPYTLNLATSATRIWPGTRRPDDEVPLRRQYRVNIRPSKRSKAMRCRRQSQLPKTMLSTQCPSCHLASPVAAPASPRASFSKILRNSANRPSTPLILYALNLATNALKIWSGTPDAIQRIL